METKQNIRWIQRLENFEKALQQLTEAVDLFHARQLSKLEHQGLIQSFEYTHELAWNTLKDFMTQKGGYQLFGSKDVTQLAFKLGLIQNGQIWMEMIKSRNLSTHTYNEATAESINQQIINCYFKEFQDLCKKLNDLKVKQFE